ncbi:hypothetical protein ACHAPF_005030 [Botrytis cinerea]
MSLENTDSHNNNMAPVKDETADEEVQYYMDSFDISRYFNIRNDLHGSGIENLWPSVFSLDY